MTIWQRWKQTALHNKALVLTSVLVAFGTLFYAGAAAFQLWMMNQTSQHTDEQIGRIIGNVNWMARSGDLSQQQSRKSLQASINQFQLDQRAWVSVRADSASPEIGKTMEIGLIIQNTGKTYARSVLVCKRIIETRKEEPSPTVAPPMPALPPCDDTKRFQLLSPGLVVVDSAFAGSTGDAGLAVGMSQATLDRFNMGKNIPWVYGKITYEDVFKRPHWLKFCFFRTVFYGKAVWAPCPDERLNEADNND